MAYFFNVGFDFNYNNWMDRELWRAISLESSSLFWGPELGSGFGWRTPGGGYHYFLTPLIWASSVFESLSLVYFSFIAFFIISSLSVFAVFWREYNLHIGIFGLGLVLSSWPLLYTQIFFYNPSISISLFTISTCILYFGLTLSRPLVSAAAFLIIGFAGQIHISSLVFFPMSLIGIFVWRQSGKSNGQLLASFCILIPYLPFLFGLASGLVVAPIDSPEIGMLLTDKLANASPGRISYQNAGGPYLIKHLFNFTSVTYSNLFSSDPVLFRPGLRYFIWNMAINIGPLLMLCVFLVALFRIIFPIAREKLGEPTKLETFLILSTLVLGSIFFFTLTGTSRRSLPLEILGICLLVVFIGTSVSIALGRGLKTQIIVLAGVGLVKLNIVWDLRTHTESWDSKQGPRFRRAELICKVVAEYYPSDPELADVSVGLVVKPSGGNFELGYSHTWRQSGASLRHMYATFRLSDEVSPFLLARQMGTSVEMLEQHYGQVVNRLVATQITKTRSRQTVKVTENVYPF